MIIDDFKKIPIMGILRGVKEEIITPLVETIVNSGLKTVEITMNTENAPELINKMVKAAKKNITVGAGTVLNLDDMHKALNAGATFIVSPTFVPEVVEYCCKNNIPVFPGALTPQEIYNAWNAGATMVKVFPVKFYGAEYIKEIKGPFNNIDLLACGGVSEKNISSFVNNGASAIAFGGSIFKSNWLVKENLYKIENAIKLLLENYKKSIS